MSTVHTRESGTRKVIVEYVEARKTYRINKFQRPAHGARLVTMPSEYEPDQEKAIEKANAWVE
jgi:type IV secretory pathway component VirB8